MEWDQPQREQTPEPPPPPPSNCAPHQQVPTDITDAISRLGQDQPVGAFYSALYYSHRYIYKRTGDNPSDILSKIEKNSIALDIITVAQFLRSTGPYMDWSTGNKIGNGKHILPLYWPLVSSNFRLFFISDWTRQSCTFVAAKMEEYLLVKPPCLEYEELWRLSMKVLHKTLKVDVDVTRRTKQIIYFVDLLIWVRGNGRREGTNINAERQYTFVWIAGSNYLEVFHNIIDASPSAERISCSRKESAPLRISESTGSRSFS